MNNFAKILIVLHISVGVEAQYEDNFGFINGEKIVGGSVADIRDAPYQISIQYYKMAFCGGSIISATVILTAAHCVQSKTNIPRMLKVRAGSKYVKNGGKVIRVCEIILHENFSLDTMDSDIALLKLCEGLPTNNVTIKPIKLPRYRERIRAGSKALTTGWGRTKDGGETSPILRKLIVPIIKLSKCAKLYSKLGRITQNMFCAGFVEGGRDSCQGDSGGPLVIGKKLVGIVSFGWGCANRGYPGVYTRVANFRKWIKRKVGI